MLFVCGPEAAAAAAAAEHSLPSPRQSIHRDSAGARWKPLAMIYGMSSPEEPVESLPPCIWWGSNLPEGKTSSPGS